MPLWKGRMAGALLLATALLTAAAPASASSAVVHSGKSTCRDIALTYDTEFSPTTQSLIDMLDELGVRTTWFFLGDSVDAYPSIVRQVAKRHQIGNHSFHHPRMPKLSREGMRAEIDRTTASVARVSATSPKPLFRPPYGEYNSTLLQVLEESGYHYLFLWSIDTRDWEGPSAETIRQRIVNGAFPGAIALMHGRPTNTVEGSRLAIGDLQARGYQFVTVTEILGIDRHLRDFGGDTYRVQRGDTWDYISSCHNLTGPWVQAYNDLAADTPPPGTVLQIPHTDELILRLDEERLTLPFYSRVDKTGWALADARFAERLGAALQWDGRHLHIRTEVRHIVLTPGNKQAQVDGTSVAMETAPARQGEEGFLVPLEFVAVQLGAVVKWDDAIHTFSMTRPAPAPTRVLPPQVPSPGGQGQTLFK